MGLVLILGRIGFGAAPTDSGAWVPDPLSGYGWIRCEVDALEFLSPQSEQVDVGPYPDLPQDHWAYEAVMSLKRLGIMVGYPPASPAGHRIR